MKRFAIAFLLVGFFVAAVQAQNSSFYIGVNGGINTSKLKHSEGLHELYPISSTRTGLNGGVDFGFELSGFTLSSGLHYIQKGGVYETDNYQDNLEIAYLTAEEKLHFLSVPILVGYRKYITDNVAFSLNIGPSINVGLKGKLDETTEYFGSTDIQTEHYNVTYGSSVNDDYRKVQVGFQISPGVVFALNENAKLKFNVTWDSGLKDSFNPRYKEANDFFKTYPGEQRNQSTVFTVGYEYHFSFADRY